MMQNRAIYQNILHTGPMIMGEVKSEKKMLGDEPLSR